MSHKPDHFYIDHTDHEPGINIMWEDSATKYADLATAAAACDSLALSHASQPEFRRTTFRVWHSTKGMVYQIYARMVGDGREAAQLNAGR